MPITDANHSTVRSGTPSHKPMPNGQPRFRHVITLGKRTACFSASFINASKSNDLLGISDRAKIIDYVQTEEYFLVEAEPLPEAASTGVENEALIRTVKMAFDNYVRLIDDAEFRDFVATPLSYARHFLGEEAFGLATTVREDGGPARELADRSFFETVVRVRTGERGSEAL